MIQGAILYEAPRAIWLFSIAFLLFWLFWSLFHYRRYYADLFEKSPVLTPLLIRRSSVQFWGTSALYCLAWCCLAYALMQPKGNGHYPEETRHEEQQDKAKQRRRAQEVVILLDASASMEVKDAPNGLSRLNFAKEIADEIASQLTGEMISLYTFTAEVAKLVPPTLDYVFFRLMLRQVSINEGDVAGTDFVSLLDNANIQALLSTSSKQKTLVFLSDGGDTAIEDLQGAPRYAALKNLSNLIGKSLGGNVQLFAVGIGSSTGGLVPDVSFQGQPVRSVLQEDILKSLIVKGRGMYFSASYAAAPEIAKDILKLAAENKPYYEEGVDEAVSTQRDLLYDLYYQLPLGIAVVMLLLILVWPPCYVQKCWIVGFVFASLSLASDQKSYAIDSVWLRAQENKEAGNYAEALKVYKELEGKAQTAWEKAVLQYDMGGVYLAEKKGDQAIQLWGSLVIEPGLPPLLAERAWTNIAVARYEQAKALLQNEELNRGDLARAIFLLHETIGAAKEAEREGCVLQKEKGLTECTDQKDLTILLSAAYEALSSAFEEMDLYLQTKSSLSEAISLFTAAAQVQLRQLALLNKKILTPDIRKEYVGVFYEEAKSWVPAWKNAKINLEQGLEKAIYTSKERELFLSAESFFTEAGKQLQSGEIAEALLSWKKMESSLRQLLRLLLGGDPLKELAQRLHESLQLALAENPLQETTLRSLQSEWMQTIETSQIDAGKNKAEWKQMLDKTNAFIEKSLHALDESKRLAARFYLTNGLEVLEQFLWKIDHSQSPVDLLRYLLLVQQNALSLDRLWQRISVTDEKDSTLAALTLAVQEKVLAVSNEFIPAVLANQHEVFQSPPPLTPPDHRCQSHPWKEALPLFHKGYSAAKQAAELMKAASLRSSYAIPLQETAVKLWEQALAKMQEPPTGTNGCYTSGGGQSSEGTKKMESRKPQQLPSKKNEQTPSFEDVLQYLQEMDQQDRGKKNSAPIKQGAKPW
jgi:hypothetical protein